MAAVRAPARLVRSLLLTLLAGASLAACATQPKYASRLPDRPSAGPAAPHAPTPRYKVGAPYQVGGIWYVPREQPDYDEEGIASWYGPGFHQKATANGEVFDQALLSAAHTTLPLPSFVEVTNLENGRRLELRVNDRGPFVGGRIIDLSQEAARRLGFEAKGTARVRVRYLGRAPLPASGLQYASASRTPPPPMAAVPPATPAPADPWASPRTIAAPGAIAASELTPLAPPAAPARTPAAAPYPAPEPAPLAEPPFRIQAGAFTHWENARKTADAIDASGVGKAKIETVYQDGVNVYRVLLDGPADELEATLLREQVAASGFAEARVVRR